MNKYVRYTAAAILVSFVFYAAYISMGHNLARIGCETEEELKSVELSGVRFDVTYLSCDTLAKDEAIRVYAEKVIPHAAWHFPGWRGNRTLLFRYDPMRNNSPLPAITSTNSSAILISVPEVSSISQQDRKWADISINYEIGHVQYPATPSR